MNTLKLKFMFLVLVSLAMPLTSVSADVLDDYLSSFTYQERKDMKIDSTELVELLRKGEAQLVGIRFPEEFAAWRMGFAINIPINELPGRLNELGKSKNYCYSMSSQGPGGPSQNVSCD